MVRGLLCNWRQTIFYDCDCKMNKPLLTNIIESVEDTGFVIVAFGSDMGGSNRGFLRDLEIVISNTLI